jgi:hypothetical protein
MAERKGPSVNYFTLRCVAHRKIRPEARPFGVMKPWSARASRETCYKQSMPLADLNALWPADANATPWVATQDGSWTRLVGAGVNPDLAPSKEARRNAPADRSSAPPI